MVRHSLVILTDRPEDRSLPTAVLRENERRPDAFEDTVIYIFKNPERAGLAVDWGEWPYAGSILPGYPDLAAAGFGGFWPMFWKIHNRERTRFGS